MRTERARTEIDSMTIFLLELVSFKSERVSNTIDLRFQQRSNTKTFLHTKMRQFYEFQILKVENWPPQICV